MKLDFKTYRELEPRSKQITTYVCYHKTPHVFTDESYYETSFRHVKKFVPENIGRVNIGNIPLLRFISAYVFGRDKKRSGYVDSLGKIAEYEIVKIEFQEGVRIYAALRGKRDWVLFSNVKKVSFDIPTKGYELQKEPRIYVMNLKLYERYILLPNILWPKRINNFLGWARKKGGPLEFTSDSTFELWDKTEDPEKHLEEKFIPDCERYYPPRNIKSVAELKAYNEWLMTDYHEHLKSRKIKKYHTRIPHELVSPLQVIPVDLRQEEVEKWVSEKTSSKSIELI